jgi:hypothetical protein
MVATLPHPPIKTYRGLGTFEIARSEPVEQSTFPNGLASFAHSSNAAAVSEEG